MDSLRTEEEQVAALKQFWKDYGSAILLGILLSLGAVYGWKAWKSNQLEQAQLSSGIYQEILDLSLRQAGQPLSEDQQASFDNLMETLQTDYNDTVYMQLSALLKAGKAVQSDDLNTARNQLEWVLLQNPGPEIEIIARMRLARVLLSQSGGDIKANAEEALVLLNQIDQAGSFKASYEDVRGDVLLALGRRDEAREAYQRAIDVATEFGEQRPLVSIKLDDLTKAKGI
ncbi:tetratricopeptide repeat protein [Parendozoicomonas sp. Alg238-R29]|uniref:YfgM family protein n=1 Tax=Parendozoicomonas sp. Alg238-R29 TaxID=2993446 RepID=UPI00248E9643|nr:tetratricopeptide repeat protein [Parendozoicomonas sp. Alg238-R29]